MQGWSAGHARRRWRTQKTLARTNSQTYASLSGTVSSDCSADILAAAVPEVMLGVRDATRDPGVRDARRDPVFG